MFYWEKIALGTDKNRLSWDFPLLEIKVSHKIINSYVSFMMLVNFSVER